MVFSNVLCSLGFCVHDGLVTSTNQQVADLLTKCLGREKFEQFRHDIGILEVSQPETWQFASLSPGPKIQCKLSVAHGFKHVGEIVEDMIAWKADILILDLCSEEGFRHLHGKIVNKHTCYVVQSTQHRHSLPGSVSFFQKLIRAVRSRMPSLQVLGWISPPCTGGLPMQHLCPANKNERIEKLWKDFFGVSQSWS